MPIRTHSETSLPDTRTPWGVRNWIQLGVLAATIGIGLQFYLHVLQAGSGGAVTVARPAGVEGFLPIGALMGWKRFLVNGRWDTVHPAGMVILGFAALVSLLARKSFCSWFCPVGTVSEGLWKLGRRLLGRNVQLPRKLDWLLRGCKYALLGFFVVIIMRMDTATITRFLESPYYRMADVKMLHFFTRMSATTALVIAALVVLSLLIRNFWCRYLCPYGALMGLLALASPLRIRRREATCIQCGQCTRACPHQIAVHAKQSIAGPECSACLDCIQVCPATRTLGLESRIPVTHVWRPGTVGTAIVLLFVGSVYLAQITGHWKSRLSTRDFQIGLMMMQTIPENRTGMKP